MFTLVLKILIVLAVAYLIGFLIKSIKDYKKSDDELDLLEHFGSIIPLFFITIIGIVLMWFIECHQYIKFLLYIAVVASSVIHFNEYWRKTERIKK